MKKIIEKILCVILPVVFAVPSFLFARYAENSNSIRYLGNQYTEVSDVLDLDFIPFGYYNSFYQENNDFATVFGISYEKKDINRNFVYVMGGFGNTVFKKDDYEIPYNPLPEDIDEIVILINSEKTINITEENDIAEVTSYFNSINGKLTSSDIEHDVYIYAASYINGGLFELTSNGRHVSVDDDGNYYIDVVGERIYVSQNIQNIIDSYDIVE